MAIDNKATKLRNDLEQHLMTLKRNRENVSLELLKTKYAAGYKALCTKIKQTASAYLKETILSGIRIHKYYTSEGVFLIQKSIDDSRFIRELSIAAFRNQDISEFDSLAAKLLERILSDLEDFYYRHLGLYISRRCVEEPNPAPEIYCFANNCILQDGIWIPLEDFKKTEETINTSGTSTEKQICA